MRTMTPAQIRAEIAKGRADFRGVDLRCADFRGKELSGADFRGANLIRALFRGSILSGADFRGATLIEADFIAADLSGADFREADLSEADLGEANISGADFRWATISGARLSEPIARIDFGGWSVCVRSHATSIGGKTCANNYWLDLSPDEAVPLRVRQWWETYGETVKAAIRCVMKHAKKGNETC